MMKKLSLLLLAALPVWSFAWTVQGPETTATAELKQYLARSVKGEVKMNGQPAVFVVGTANSELGEDEWMIQTRGNDVILTGGGSRGTLYAVYRFLEDYVGIRWWSPWAEKVPVHESLELSKIDAKGKPFFLMRDVYRSTLAIADDDGRWNIRNRLNRNGDTPIGAKWGGAYTFGRPYHVHTFDKYVQPGLYMEKHPEYFSEVDGKRVGGQLTGQICLTNPDVLALVKANLRFFINLDRSDAVKNNLPPPQVYDISINDNGCYCRCVNCLEAAKDGNQTDILLEFINAVADSIKDQYPEIFINTLAYLYTEETPTRVVPRDNVIIRFCDTATNPALPFDAPENRHFVENLAKWGRIAKNLSIWDYSIIYVRTGMPLPHEFMIAEATRGYAANNVKMMFWEHEHPECADMWELTTYLEAKLMENPEADATAITAEFMNDFYGKAAPQISEYRQKLLAETLRIRPKLHWFSAPQWYDQLNLANVRNFDAILQKAAVAVAGDEIMTQRVNRVRMSLDRSVIFRYGILMQEHLQQGGRIDNFPVNREAIKARIEATWRKAVTILKPEAQAKSLETMQFELDVYGNMLAAKCRPTAKFGNQIYDFPSYYFSIFHKDLKFVSDPQAESGVAVVTENPNLARMPVSLGIHAPLTNEAIASRAIEPAEVAGAGYNWYKIATAKLKHISVLYGMGWNAQLPLDRITSEFAGNPAAANTEYEVWARIKFTGPAFPHGRQQDSNAIFFDRVVILPAGSK